MGVRSSPGPVTFEFFLGGGKTGWGRREEVFVYFWVLGVAKRMWAETLDAGGKILCK